MSEPPDDEDVSETGDSLEDDAVVVRSPWWNTDLASVLFLHSDKGGGEELGRGGGASSVGGDTSNWFPTWLLVETSSMVPLKMSNLKSMQFRHNFHALVLNPHLISIYSWFAIYWLFVSSPRQGIEILSLWLIGWLDLHVWDFQGQTWYFYKGFALKFVKYISSG